MLKNLKVGVRLALSFAIIVVLLGLIVITSLQRLRALDESTHLLVEDRFPKVMQVDDCINHVGEIARALRNMILWEDPEEVKKEENRITEVRKKITDIMNALSASIKSDEGKRLLATVESSRDKYIAAQDMLIAMINRGQKEAAISVLLGSYRTLQNDYLSAFNALRTYQVSLSNQAAKKSASSVSQAVILLIVIGIVAAILAITLALIITKSIVAPLSLCIAAAERIAGGDLDVSFDTTGRDETAQLQRTMASMSETLKRLISDMNHMSSEHDAGDIDVRIDENTFKGAFQEMARGVNTMVFGHIAVKKKAMACVAEFGRGNFEAPLEKFPGKKAFINETIEQVRANLKALISDTNILTQAAIEGRLSTRAEAEKHHGDFRKIIEGVNKTLDLVITPVNETIAILKRMADGDLTATMTGDYRGDFDVLKTALNDTISAMNDILAQVAQAVGQVTAGSQQVSQASQALSQGATEQASSLEQITSSVTEIAGQTKKNTENSVQVNTLAKDAKSNAEQGDSQMKELVAAMSDINKSAEEIKKIVNAIDDISFQINLLALNANVEAARAGKYGKGFAVVAEEVRNLAVRSAGSVKETTSMVDEAIANIGRGNSLVEVTAKQLASIVSGSSQVASLAEEVSTASREQSQGLEQITTGLNQIDQVTQANTASAEESASAAEELSSQAQQLKGMIEKFRLQEKSGRMTEERMLAMLRSEMAQGSHAGKPRVIVPRNDEGASPAAPGAKAASPVKRALNPVEFVSSDDDFGKF